MAFQFPQTIQAQGSVWHLIYAPDLPNTLLPSLIGAKVQSVFGQWVQVPDGTGGQGRLYMCVVDLIMPEVNTSTYRKPAQYVRGFSLSPKEADANTMPPEAMAIYTKELEPPVNVAQEFLNAVLGTSYAQQQQQAKGDWTNLLPSPKAPEEKTVSQPHLRIGNEAGNTNS